MPEYNLPYSSFNETEANFPDYYDENKKLSDIYSAYLVNYNSHFTDSGNYLQFGAIVQPQGWILHLSIVKSQIIALFKLLIPHLIDKNIPFKIPVSLEVVDWLLDGKLGYTVLGKIVSIYPEDDRHSIELLREIIPLTEQFVGPTIPTDRQLHNIIYTRYGSFNIYLTDKDGQARKHIYDKQGRLFPDPYAIPFDYPPYVLWPFAEFAAPRAPVENKLMNFKYYPLKTLKYDAKGKVIKALYFQNFYQIKSCLIKEGKHNMFSDVYNRDIRDRLKWQYQIQTSLYKTIPVPKAIEYFQHHENHYFVMEYVQGDSFLGWLGEKKKDRLWKDLSISTQLIILNKLLEIIDVVGDLHKLEYVHRDINPDNIAIRKNGRIVLIDMELAWSLKSGTPSPPFQLGTNGFMSPQQLAMHKPTVKEDIYALGALMIMIFTSLSPNKLTYKINENLIENLFFFIGEKEIPNLIYQCLKHDPATRSSTSEIRTVIARHYNTLRNLEKGANNLKSESPGFSKSLHPLIVSALNGLSYHRLLSTENIWLSRVIPDENYIANNSDQIKLSTGWHTGAAGAIWLVARAKRLGFDVSSCDQPFFNSWQYLMDEFLTNMDQKPAGLYYGAAGIALALAESINSGQLTANEQNLDYLSCCFSLCAPVGGLSYGIAGQGIALLSCAKWLPSDQFSKLLQTYIQFLLDSQQSDGSWLHPSGIKDKSTLVGFSEGISGIVWFLLASLHYAPNDDVQKAVHKTLRWLKSKNKYGSQNFALVFIKAYELYHDREFKKIAERWLFKNPARKVVDDLSFKSGLAALGETYLEAWLAFNNPCWMDRAEKTAQVLAHAMQKRSEHQGFWILDLHGIITADLFNGCGGILHFLLRTNNQQALTHPLWPTISQ
jgi:serine/threonine protein kinase